MLAVVDGLIGFPDAITAVFPETFVQNCIVHLLRNSMELASYKGNRGRFLGGYVAASLTRSGRRGTEGLPWTPKRSPRKW